MDEMTMKTKENRKKLLVQLLSGAVFLALLLGVFCKVTYLYRGGDDEQIFLKGIETADAEVIYVGGSASFMFWQPPQAWAEQGIASYCYGTNGIQAENLLPYVREVLRHQDPELLILDARPFEYWSPEFDEVGLRKGSDAMSLWSPNRYRLIRDTFRYREVPEEDRLSYYLDITKYHTKPWALASENAWKYAFREVEAPYAGGRWKGEHLYLDTPDVDSTRPVPLADSSRELLENLLYFCKSEGLEALLVVSPYYETTQSREAFNEIGRITEEYGFRFLNGNQYYEEMGLDFARDFYDKNHVNILGAQKFTSFLGSYLREHYELTDRSDDGHWAECYGAWTEAIREDETAVSESIRALENNLTISALLPETEDLSRWTGLLESGDYLLLLGRKGQAPVPEDPAQQALLRHWAMDGENTLAVVDSGRLLYSGSEAWEGSTGGNYPVDYSLREEGDTVTLSLDGRELVLREPGIALVVLDKATRKEADRLVLTWENGSLTVNR